MNLVLILYILLVSIFIIGSIINLGKYRNFIAYDGSYHLEPSNSTTAIWLTLIGIIGIYICVNRPKTLPDYEVYQYLYHGDFFSSKKIEITYELIKSISPTFYFLLAIYAIISISIKLFAIQKLSANIWLSLLSYFSASFLLHDMIQMRASVAAAICLISIKYLVERNLKFYFSLIFIASLFHFSAIIFFPFWFLNSQEINRSLYYWILPVTLALFFFKIGLAAFSNFIPIDAIRIYFETYKDNPDFKEFTVGPIWILKSLMAIYCVNKSYTYLEQYPYAIIVLKISIFGLSSYLLFMDIPVMAGRISEFLNITQILFYASLPLAFGKYKHMAAIFVIIICIFQAYRNFQELILDNIIGPDIFWYIKNVYLSTSCPTD